MIQHLKSPGKSFRGLLCLILDLQVYLKLFVILTTLTSLLLNLINNLAENSNIIR